jgi:RNA polymerase sigma-70 factor (ECF subfamily)
VTEHKAHPDHDSCAFGGDDIATSRTASDGAGQREAQEVSELYEMWFPQVRRWIQALGGPGIDAEDLTQEVFIVVQRKLPGFDRANLAGWLYRIADLTVRDHRRRAWFRRRSSQSCDVELDEVVSPTAGPDEQLARKQREMYLYELIRQVNPRWRDSFLLFYIAGLSGEQLANLHGISAATVRTHLSRARKAILDLAARLPTKDDW